MNGEQEFRRNAFRQLLKTNGKTVILDGEKIDAFVEEMTADEVILAGGRGEAGGFRVNIAVEGSKLTDHEVSEEPEKGMELTARKKTLEVVSVVNRNQVTYEITVGDLNA